VCCAVGVGEAVLVRAIEAEFGTDWMKGNRPVEKDTQLTSGPGKICVALKMDRSLDGANLCDVNSEVFVAENPEVKRFRRRFGPIVTTTRIGLTQAADWPLRFYLRNSAFVSKKVKL
jgi:DNA-3-methyladenine glycosylase